MSSNSVCNHTHDWQIWLPLCSNPILFIPCMITDYNFSLVLARRICWQSKLLRLLIISFILMTLMSDSAVLLQGEIRCWSLIECKGLRSINEYQKTEVFQSKNPGGEKIIMNQSCIQTEPFQIVKKQVRESFWWWCGWTFHEHKSMLTIFLLHKTNPVYSLSVWLVS